MAILKHRSTRSLFEFSRAAGRQARARGAGLLSFAVFATGATYLKWDAPGRKKTNHLLSVCQNNRWMRRDLLDPYTWSMLLARPSFRYRCASRSRHRGAAHRILLSLRAGKYYSRNDLRKCQILYSLNFPWNDLELFKKRREYDEDNVYDMRAIQLDLLLEKVVPFKLTRWQEAWDEDLLREMPLVNGMRIGNFPVSVHWKFPLLEKCVMLGKGRCV